MSFKIFQIILKPCTEIIEYADFSGIVLQQILNQI